MQEETCTVSLTWKKIKKKLITVKTWCWCLYTTKNATVTIHTQELMVQKHNRLNVNMISLIWIRMYYSKFYHAFKTNRMAHVMRCTVPDSCKGFVPYSSRGSLNKGGLCSHIGYCDINGTLPVFFLDKSPPSKPCAQSCMQLGVLFLCIYCRRAK